jgi:hypothetical protein
MIIIIVQAAILAVLAADLWDLSFLQGLWIFAAVLIMTDERKTA